jgi:Fur family zinc uptake transcriptional regulator
MFLRVGVLPAYYANDVNALLKMGRVRHMVAPVHAAFLPPKHNHARCVENAARMLRDAFKHHGLALTPLREEIFREIAASHRSVGAYEVRDMLIAKGRRVPPISVYRAIRTLMQAGVVRRFESENAFYASSGNDPASPRIVLACQQCGCVGDADGAAAFDVLKRAVASRAFAPKGAVVEVHGTCEYCAKIAPAGSR